ncbi:NifB/NifX family molybdenum-iron cluster-binding protein [Bacteroidota bacterium]
MRIAVASDDGMKISSHFGQTKGFAIIDINDDGKMNKSYIKNTFTGHARGMHNSHDHTNKHQTILNALTGCDVVISNGMGRKIYDDLTNAGIKPIITDETVVDTAIKLFLDRKLTDHPDKGCVH